MVYKENKGLIFNVQEYGVQDGTGIRTVVFLKGCPLQCQWCSNPEGQNSFPELMHIKTLCKQCKQCLSVCSKDAISFDKDGFPIIKRDICLQCLEKTCAQRCPQRAIKVVGEYWSAKSLYAKVKTYSRFYIHSDGGITLSGGEPFAQPEFVKEFVELCKKIDLSIGFETCGLFDWDKVEDYIDKFDFYYFDIKCLDTKLHQKTTGSENEMIFENLKRLAKLNPSKIIVTIPVVPGVNTNEQMFLETAELCKKLSVSKIRLLPYHSYGKTKYIGLGKEYLMEDNLSVSKLELERFKSIITEKGINCWVE